MIFLILHFIAISLKYLSIHSTLIPHFKFYFGFTPIRLSISNILTKFPGSRSLWFQCLWIQRSVHIHVLLDHQHYLTQLIEHSLLGFWVIAPQPPLFLNLISHLLDSLKLLLYLGYRLFLNCSCIYHTSISSYIISHLKLICPDMRILS